MTNQLSLYVQNFEKRERNNAKRRKKRKREAERKFQKGTWFRWTCQNRAGRKIIFRSIKIYSTSVQTIMSRYNINNKSLDSALDSQFVNSCINLNPGRQLNMYSDAAAMNSCQYGLVTRKNHARSFQCPRNRLIIEDNGMNPGVEPQANLYRWFPKRFRTKSARDCYETALHAGADLLFVPVQCTRIWSKRFGMCDEDRVYSVRE